MMLGSVDTKLGTLLYLIVSILLLQNIERRTRTENLINIFISLYSLTDAFNRCIELPWVLDFTRNMKCLGML